MESKKKKCQKEVVSHPDPDGINNSRTFQIYGIYCVKYHLCSFHYLCHYLIIKPYRM